jgi:hypothetical protein
LTVTFEHFNGILVLLEHLHETAFELNTSRT